MRRTGKQIYEQRRKTWPIEKLMCRNVESRAHKEGIACSITPEFIKQIWPKDNCCPITGEPFYFDRDIGNCGPSPDTPTIDRIDPRRGYFPNNIAVISQRANRIKCDEVEPEIFLQIYQWMMNQRTGQPDMGFFQKPHDVRPLADPSEIRPNPCPLTKYPCIQLFT
jgi:hypothetical protein